MIDGTGIEELIALSVTIVGLAAAYAKAFGAHQRTIAEWVIASASVPARHKGLVNLGVGLAVATVFSSIAATMLGAWMIVPVGAFAGLLASVEASRIHDREKGE